MFYYTVIYQHFCKLKQQQQLTVARSSNIIILVVPQSTAFFQYLYLYKIPRLCTNNNTIIDTIPVSVLPFMFH